MKKLFLTGAAIALIAVSCDKKADKVETTTETTTETTPAVVVDTTVVHDTINAATPSTTAPAADMINQKFTSEDGKTNFELSYDAAADKAVLTNKATNEVYNMKSAKSASGAKYSDDKGNYFWIHQGQFEFGKNDTKSISGKEIK